MSNLTPQQQAHLDGIVKRFEAFVRPKYTAGAEEHGGNLWEVNGIIRMAKEEVADLWVYLDTLEQQLEAHGITQLGIRDEQQS